MELFLKQIHKKFYLITLLFLVNSCTEPIEFDTPKNLHLLVVDGKITNSGQGNTIKLSRTTNTDQILEPVFAATVKIFDDLGREELFYPRFDLGNGIYFHPEEILKGEPGLTYIIEITLLDDGSVYRSKPEKMPIITATDSIFYDFTTIKEQNDIGNFVDRKAVEIYVDIKFEQQNNTSYLKWDIEEVYKISPTVPPNPFNIMPPCYITSLSGPQEIRLLNLEQANLNKISAKKLTTRKLDFAFSERFIFNIHSHYITKEAYNYWSEVNQVVNIVGSVFDSPPAPIKGNIYNIENPDEQVLGYFQASAFQTTRILLIKADIPFFIPPYCEYTPGKVDYPEPCSNCLILLNSSLERPEYF